MNLKKLLPILTWLPNYKKEYIKGDINAGITVGIMLIPQGMAYAMLAGLPPIYGLYASIVPQLIYAIFGTSRQLGVGPVAMDSLLVATIVGTMAQTDSQHYIDLAVLLAFMVGVIHLLMGTLRLGFLVNLLSKPVISGFTSAAALIIGFSQLKYLMGVNLGRSSKLHEILYAASQKISEINIYALAIGVAGIVIIKVLKKWKPQVPAPLMVVIFGILVVYFGGLEAQNVAIVKEVPEGLPTFSLPAFWDFKLLQQLLPGAITIALVAFMEAIAVGKSIEAQHNDYKIEPNQELLALGGANLVGSFFKSFPTTGGFSRSAVNNQAGARTNLANIISATFVMGVLLFFTSWFYFLPKTVLASIIMVAVFKLISLQDAIDLWKKGYKIDLAILIVTFIATLTLSITIGILTGVVLSLLNIIRQTMQPKLETTSEKSTPNTLTIKVKEQICFTNNETVKQQIETVITDNPLVTKFVIDGTTTNQVDSTGEMMLLQLSEDYEDKSISISFVHMPEKFNKN